MSNINLLPEELRRREQKELEHLAKQRRAEKIELNRPLPVQQAIKKESDKPKRSWFRDIFGVRPEKKVPPTAMPHPIAKSSLDMDLLAASKKKKFNYKFGGKPEEFIKAGYAGPSEQHPARPQPPQPKWQPRPVQPIVSRAPNGFFKQSAPAPATPPAPYKMYAKPVEKQSFWAKLFAKKQKPPRPIVPPKPTAKPQPPLPAPLPPARPPQPPKKEPRDSWWKILHGLFTFSKKKNISGLHVAGERQKIAAVSAPFQHPNGGQKPEIRPARPSYHQAPPPARPAIQINLAKLPPEHHEPNFALLLLIFIAAWILPALLVYGCVYFISQQQAGIDQQLAQEQQRLNQLNAQLSPYLIKQERLDAFNSRLLALKLLLQRQNSWDNFFTLLEKYTLDEVYYRQLSAEAGGQMSLSAIAPDYQAAARQTAVFAGDEGFAKEIKVNESREINDEKVGRVMVNFLPRMYLQPGVFNKDWLSTK